MCKCSLRVGGAEGLCVKSASRCLQREKETRSPARTRGGPIPENSDPLGGNMNTLNMFYVKFVSEISPITIILTSVDISKHGNRIKGDTCGDFGKCLSTAGKSTHVEKK